MQTVSPKHPSQPFELRTHAKQTPPPHLAAVHNSDGARVIINLGDVKSKSRVRSDPSKGVLAWVAGGSSKNKKGKAHGKDFVHHFFAPGAPEGNKSSRPTSSIEREEKRRRQTFLQQDPLNVHQTILKNLQGSARAPITSVYDLAKLITSSCVDVFDQYRIPPDFQFFDFFERSIGAVVSKTSITAERKPFP
jgi:hypothetical protein